MESATECKPLIERDKHLHVKEGYSTASHCSVEDHGGTSVLKDYKVWPLSTFRVLAATRGSILAEPVLWIEQLLITVIFFVASMPVFFLFSFRLATDHRGEEVSIRRWVLEQEPNMRNFAMIMTGLCVFLLSFYTSLGVGRWWTIRTQGLGGIKAASTELEMLIYNLVDKDPQVTDSIRRYTVASLLLCFLWRGNQLNQMEDVLIGRGILTKEEVGLLKNWNHNLHETIWAWHTRIVTMLYKQGKIKSDQLLQLLLDRCREGRASMQLIHTHLAVKVPMQYVHMLGFLVKFHNTVLAFIMGILFGAAINAGQYIICLQLFGRTLIMPFLFNAILCINAQLADPFDGGVASFPRDAYLQALEKDCRAFIDGSKNVPAWIRAADKIERGEELGDETRRVLGLEAKP